MTISVTLLTNFNSPPLNPLQPFRFLSVWFMSDTSQLSMPTWHQQIYSIT